ncbi:MAG: hypothetical protein E7241_08990 [Lachnospiraceae bacterium]|nr:hypothetical protein [Lachnospiraceae bacterium]
MQNKESKPYRIYIWSFVLPILIMFGVFVARGIYPFGDECFLHCDLYHQYLPFLKEFGSIIKSGNSLLYSWHAGLGTNFLAIFVYYLATPSNWLSLLVSQDFLIEFISYMVILKTGLAGITFSHYLKSRFKLNDRVIILFSLGYTMSAFFAAYNWNVMWIDCLVMFPLIILGLERLVNEGRMSLYIVSLGFCIFTNYYLSIMICIYLVLYFIVLWISAEHKWSAIWRFATGSLLSGGIASVLLLPEIYAVYASEFTGGTIPRILNSYFSLFEAFARGLMNVDVEIGLDHWPNVYCGVAILFLIFLYMFTGKIKLRERIPTVILALVLLASFCFNIPNYIWHGLNYPNSLPARQSFIYIFLLLTMGYEAYIHIRETSWFWVVISGIIGGGVVACAYMFVKDDAFSIWSFVCSGGAILIYFVFICIFKFSKSARQTVLFVLTGLVLITELTTNMLFTGVATVSRSSYVRAYEKYEYLANSIESKITSFYRIEKLSRLTQNDSMLSDFSSASLFSSVSNALVKKFYERNGLRCSKVYYAHDGSTPLTSALLSVKYVMGERNDKNYENDPFFVNTAVHDNVALYKCRYFLPMGFSIESTDNQPDISSKEAFANAEKRGRANLTVFEQQNLLGKSLGAKGDIFTPFDVISSSGSTIIDVPKNGRVYAYTSNGGISKITALCGGSSRAFTGYTDNYIMDLGYHSAGDIITLSTDNTTSILHTTAVMFDEDVMNELITERSKETYNISQYDNTYITGNITVGKDCEMLTSIPYDTNWEVTVDGEKVSYKAFEDAFISVPLTVGSHRVEFTYTNNHYLIGLILSIVCIGIWMTIAIYEKYKYPDETVE